MHIQHALQTQTDDGRGNRNSVFADVKKKKKKSRNVTDFANWREFDYEEHALGVIFILDQF